MLEKLFVVFHHFRNILAQSSTLKTQATSPVFTTNQNVLHEKKHTQQNKNNKSKYAKTGYPINVGLKDHMNRHFNLGLISQDLFSINSWKAKDPEAIIYL